VVLLCLSRNILRQQPNIRGELKYKRILEYFCCVIGSTLEACHTVAQYRTVTCCECGSVNFIELVCTE
jgi:hypothetical protein